MTHKYIVKTLGCKANLYDSQLLEAQFQKEGWEPAQSAKEDEVEVIIVNGCTVTDEADKQSRKLAQKLGKLNPRAKVVFTGCGAEAEPQQVSELATGIDYIISNRDKKSLFNWIGKEEKKIINRDEVFPQKLGAVYGYEEMNSKHPQDREWPLPEELFFNPLDLKSENTLTGLKGHSGRTRAFLKIQEGCESFCTYCIIPYGRGPSRSLRPKKVIDQIRSLVESGVQEVVFTGTNVGDYGVEWADKGRALEELLEKVLSETSLKRLRVSSLDPIEITPRIIELMKNHSSLCPHFHVSLQHTDSKILRLMKRKYREKDVIETLKKIDEIKKFRGNVFVGMDYITGFPGESLECFESSRSLLDKLPWSRLHVFPYSERSNTPATRLPNSVEKGERKRRSKILSEDSMTRLESIYQEQLKKRGSLFSDVLVESRVKGPDGTRNWMSGYTPDYLRVLIPYEARLENKIIDVYVETVIIDRSAVEVSYIGKEKA